MELGVHIQKLEFLTRAIHFDAEQANVLYNPVTQGLCQILEYTNTSDSGNHRIKDHYYKKSDELFFVVEGTLTFNDGIVLTAGKFRFIKAGDTHGAFLSKNGKVIIIVRPPDTEYNKVVSLIEVLRNNKR